MTDHAGKNPVNNKLQKESKRKQKWLLTAIILLLFLYIGGAFLAPVMMKTGHHQFAQIIYKAYRVACHQLPYRSIFLFGEQDFYPRELAGIKGLKTYEEITGFDEADSETANIVIGTEQMGYKVALCQRDIAIFSSMLLFILIYVCFGMRIKPVPWWVWLFVAVMPIGLDGFSQLISQMSLPWLSCIAVRESTPFLRFLTGYLFGFFSAWFIIPSICGDLDHSSDPRPIRQKIENLQGLEEKDINENY